MNRSDNALKALRVSSVSKGFKSGENLIWNAVYRRSALARDSIDQSTRHCLNWRYRGQARSYRFDVHQLAAKRALFAPSSVVSTSQNQRKPRPFH